MFTKNKKFKCDWCGRFISHNDMMNGEAYHRFTPDSNCSVENMELSCKKCNKEEQNG